MVDGVGVGADGELARICRESANPAYVGPNAVSRT
jgi:hypothetical protein